MIVNANVSISDPNILWQRDGVDLSNNGTSIEVTETGFYELFVSTDNNCTSSASFNADFGDSPEVDLGEDILTCTGAITILDAGSEGDNYVWKRNGFTFADGPESVIEVDNFGTYSVVATSANGCIGVDTITVDTEALPEIDFGRDITRCFGNFYTIEAEESPFEIQWYLNDVAIPGANDIEYTALESGVYVGQVFVNDQCIAGDTIEIEYLDIPNVDFPDMLSACPGEIILLEVDDPNAVFMWFSEADGMLPETGNLLEVTADGTYIVEARSTTTFCIVRDTVEVSFIDIPLIDLGTDIIACDGETIDIGSPTEGFLAEWYKDGDLITGETGEILAVTESGEYTMRISSGSNCETEDIITVTFNASPEVDLGSDVTSCPGEIVELLAGDGSDSYAWSRNGGMLTETSNILQVSADGNYSVTVTNSNDCSTSAEVNVTFTELPNLDLGPDLLNCDDDIYTIDANASGFQVEWFVNGTLEQNNNTDILTAEVSGEYIALVNAGANCSIADTLNIEYLPYPEVDLGVDQFACPGETIILEVPDFGYNYEWKGEANGLLSETSNILSVTETDSYIVDVSNEAGCTTSDTVNIEFVNLPIISLGGDLELCEGESITLENTSNGFDIEWYRDGTLLSGSTGESIEVTEDGEYIMRVIANDNCFVSDTILVNFNAFPEIDLGEDRSACPGDNVILTAGSMTDIHSWSSESTGILPESSNTLTVFESDSYYVEAENAAGCITRDSVTISFVELPEI